MFDEPQPSVTPLPGQTSPYWQERADANSQYKVANAMMAAQSQYRPAAWQTRRGGMQGASGMGGGMGGLGGGLMALASAYAQKKQLDNLNKKYGAGQELLTPPVDMPAAPPTAMPMPEQMNGSGIDTSGGY